MTIRGTCSGKRPSSFSAWHLTHSVTDGTGRPPAGGDERGGVTRDFLPSSYGETCTGVKRRPATAISAPLLPTDRRANVNVSPRIDLAKTLHEPTVILFRRRM